MDTKLVKECDVLLPRVLHPAYQNWIGSPGEMFGFWLWMGPDVVRDQILRTGANTTSLHAPMWLTEDSSSSTGVHHVPAAAQVGGHFSSLLSELNAYAGVDIGEHNNACFVRYPEQFWNKNPQAAMRDAEGQVIKVGNNPWQAMDDPVITQLACNQMEDIVRLLHDEKRVRYWVLGGEQLYPDYLACAEGDFRPASRRHYTAWKKSAGSILSGMTEHDRWDAFREAAVVDHFALYTAFLRKQDDSRPILVPTHGNPFVVDLRSKLGYPVADFAGAADGFEAGPIAIDDDDERLIRMTLDQQVSFGVPVAAPRLGNKQLDPAARGGGKSFSPASLRRFVYEALGLGVWHIGLVQWVGALEDGEWGIAGTKAEDECKRVFTEFRQASPYLDNCSRLQPQLGIFLSDETWRRWSQDRWTLIYDMAVKAGWSITLLADAQITPDLVRFVPVVISIDNEIVSRTARKGLEAYIKAGGRVVSVGKLAENDEAGKKLQPLSGVVVVPDAEDGPSVKVAHRTQTNSGANVWKFDVRPLPLEKIETAAGKFADLRPVKVFESENGSRADGIEPLCLTDGTNVVVALINRSDKQRDVVIEPSNRLSMHLSSWTAQDLTTGKQLPMVSDNHSGARVIMEPLGTALVSLEHITTRVTVDSEIGLAERAVETWEKLGADVVLQRNLMKRAREHRDAGRTAKAYALTRSVTHSLALKASVKMANDRLLVQATVWDAIGRKAVGAKVKIRLVPGKFHWSYLNETQPGVYSLEIPQKDLPRFYNPVSEAYEHASGSVQVIFDASIPGAQGGLRKVTAFQPE